MLFKIDPEKYYRPTTKNPIYVCDQNMKNCNKAYCKGCFEILQKQD